MDTNKKVASNLFWRFLERTGAQGVTFVVSVVLARLLGPEPYGIIAILLVFINLLQVFIDAGVGVALIQKKNADELDFSTVFWFNVVLCLCLYIILFLTAPIVADFYNMPDLKNALRVLGIVIIISAMKNTQQSYVSRHLLFKKFFFSTLVGTICAAIVGIVLAFYGFGLWALITQYLVNASIDTIVLWFTVKWRPRFDFSFSRLKSLFSFGWKILASALLNSVYKDIRTLIIGKLYTSQDLAFYNQGNKFPKTLIENINTSIDSVLLPVMSNAQDDPRNVKHMTRRAIKVSTYIIMPMMIGLSICAIPIVRLLLSEKWLPCIFYMRIFCITYAFYPIHTANLNAIKAMGRSDLFLKLEILKKIVGLIALLSTVFVSVKAMALSGLLTSILNQIINSWPNRKLLDYRYGEQLQDILPQIGLSCLMGAIVFFVSFLHLDDLLTLIIQIPLGIIIYILGSKFLHLDSFEYIYTIIKSYLGRRKKAT